MVVSALWGGAAMSRGNAWDPEERARRNSENEKAREASKDWHAGLYGLRLRQEGHSPAEAAALVIERYPHTRPLLMPLMLNAPKTEKSK
jgi:hypothetical protein